MTYAELMANVIQEVGDESLAEHMDSIVQRAERTISNRLRDARMLSDTELTFTSGTARLPDDFLEVFLLTTPAGVRICPKPMRWAKLSSAYYAIAGRNIVCGKLDGTLLLTYYARLPTITTGPDGTNWLLEAAPELYEAFVKQFAAAHIRDMEARNFWRQEADYLLREFRTQAWLHNHGDQAIEAGGC